MSWKNLMRGVLFSLFGYAFTISVQAQTSYGNVIITHPKTYKLIKDAANDLQQQLSKATNQNFILNTKDSNSTTGIILVKLDAITDKNFDKRLDPLNADNVLLQSDGKTFLKIISFTRQGLIDGIYSYLDTLGFRWYHPGDLWTKVPQLTDVRIKLDNVFAPDFALRTFFGTFGTPRNATIDKKGIVDYAWIQWAARNRMGGGYQLKGHAGNEFLWRNVKVLNAHPEYMAQINGARMKPNTAVKFCISNEGMQQLFVNDMLSQLQKYMAAFPNQEAYCISVEPSDGGGDCQCDACKKMGNVSDRVFFLANLVAKEFQKISPVAFVNLYAYNTHAKPPHFELEKNVIVQIIPYGYQHDMSPEKMIEAWKKKTNNLFIYDYYGLPINNIDKPLKWNLKAEEFVKRIRYWKEQNIKGITLESSYSIGATGIGLYLYARTSWRAKTDEKKTLDEYYNFCYGKAASVIHHAQNILNDDSIGTHQSLINAMLSIQKETENLKLDSAEQARLVAYKSYLHYVKLIYNYYKKHLLPEPMASDSLLRYSWSIHNNMMVHQYPVSELLKTRGGAQGYVKKNWDYTKTGDATMKFSEVVPATMEDIEKAFEEDCKQFLKFTPM